MFNYKENTNKNNNEKKRKFHKEILKEYKLTENENNQFKTKDMSSNYTLFTNKNLK